MSTQIIKKNINFILRASLSFLVVLGIGVTPFPEISRAIANTTVDYKGKGELLSTPSLGLTGKRQDSIIQASLATSSKSLSS